MADDPMVGELATFLSDHKHEMGLLILPHEDSLALVGFNVDIEDIVKISNSLQLYLRTILASAPPGKLN